VVVRSFIASLAFNRRYVTRDRCFQDGLGIIRDDAVEVVTVDKLADASDSEEERHSAARPDAVDDSLGVGRRRKTAGNNIQ
jgi:hypothetical protein